MVGPLTLNEVNDVLLITASIIVVVPATFKLPMILTLLKLDGPDTLKDDNNVVPPETNKLVKLVLLLIENIVDIVKIEKLVVFT